MSKFCSIIKIIFSLSIFATMIGTKYDCEEPTGKKQVHCEYDAMQGYAEIIFDLFKGELKEADTCKRLCVIKDNHSISPYPKYLNDSCWNGDDSIKIFLEGHRSLSSLYPKESMYVYICAVRHLIYHKPPPNPRVESLCLGFTYTSANDTVYNESMSAIAMERIKIDEDTFHFLFGQKNKWVTAHELGHAFNLDDEYTGTCIMRTEVPRNVYFTDFCPSCINKLGKNKP